MRLRPLLLLATCLAALPALGRSAEAKPKVAILGLEVTGSSATDQKVTDAAKALTRELRREANKPTGAFELAPNSNKDLLEMKLLSDCSDEGRRCMTQIGKELGADRLVYGRLERTRGGYRVTLKLLDTKKESTQEQEDLIPFGDVTATGGLQRRARGLYSRLTGAPEDGTLEITATTERGTVYVDGQIRTSLSAGSARVSGLTEGVHSIAIEAKGYDRYESEVTISSGVTETLDAELVASAAVVVSPPAGEVDGRPGGGWRVAFWSAVVVTGAGATAWTVKGLSVLDDHKAFCGMVQCPGKAAPAGGQDLPPFGDGPNNFVDVCDQIDELSPEQRTGYDDLPTLDNLCKDGRRDAKLVNFLLAPTTVASALFGAYAYYKGYIAPGKRTSREREARSRRRRPRGPAVTISPSLGPNLVGAGLEIQF